MLHFPTGMLWFLKSFRTYIGGFSLKLGRGCRNFCRRLLHTWRNGVLHAKPFYDWCLHGYVPSWIHACSKCTFFDVTHISLKQATLFAKACCIEEWSSLCKIILQVQFACDSLSFAEDILHKKVPAYNAHVQRTTAYVEGNSCRDGSLHVSNNAALFAEAFARLCFVIFCSSPLINHYY